MTKKKSLKAELKAVFDSKKAKLSVDHGQCVMTIDKQDVIEVMTSLKTQKSLAFDQLIDVCGVDYLHYGLSQWETETASSDGFSRAVDMSFAEAKPSDKPMPERFAVVYHLLSTEHNRRLRVKVYLNESALSVASVASVYKSANWFERETYDMYGILFEGHPDLRRILTDYGFIGYPFRKDFPVSGHVEMRYDATAQKVIYEPVDIQPRTGVPKVIRETSS